MKNLKLNVDKIKDNTGKRCKKCKKGHYKEMYQLDDLKGVLHCDKCDEQIDRYTYPPLNINGQYIKEMMRSPVYWDPKWDKK